MIVQNVLNLNFNITEKGEQNFFPVSTSQSAISILLEIWSKHYMFNDKIEYVCTLGVKVQNMKMVFNISTLGFGSGNEH